MRTPRAYRHRKSVGTLDGGASVGLGRLGKAREGSGKLEMARAHARGTKDAQLTAPMKSCGSWQRTDSRRGTSSRKLGAVSSSILPTKGTFGIITAACCQGQRVT